MLVLFVLAACEEPRGELREWQPSDHQPPSGGVAEGDGRAAPPEQDPDPAVTEVRAATALYGSLCASCHGASGRGDGPARPPVATIPDLTSAEWQDSRSDEQIAQAIRDGRGGFMPGFGDRLSPAGVDALTRHVRRLGGRGAEAGAGAGTGAETGTEAGAGIEPEAGAEPPEADTAPETDEEPGAAAP